MGLAHTPYDGSRKAFTIGLSPLDPAGWVEPDADLGHFLTEKRRLLAGNGAPVLLEEPASRIAQAELRCLLADHLTTRFPSLYAREGDGLRLACDGSFVPLDGAVPIRDAALLVKEDLVLLTRGADDWRIAAAMVCFPSSWSPAEKFGQPLDAVHAPVPGYAGLFGTRVTRIFDNLRPETPLVRFNWSIYPDARLDHPVSKSNAPDWPRSDADVFIRVERQTLRRLPQSRDAVFTIGIGVDPLAALAADPRRLDLARGLSVELRGLDAAQLDYKGLGAARERVLAALERIAAAG